MGSKKPTACINHTAVLPGVVGSLKKRVMAIDELGEGPTSSKPSLDPLSIEDKVEVQSHPDEIVAVSAKKKDKKKAKTKTADVTQEEINNGAKKSKVVDKKVTKQVRLMQEQLAKMKEAEEKKKREEEEKLRREEEERKRQEEAERLEEERKRAKKEREREKILRKKQEGKLLTGKQKEEARRRESVRNQILANAGGLPLLAACDASGVPTKRPKYETKKSKQRNCQPSGVASTSSVEHDGAIEVDFREPEKVEEINALSIEEKDENGVKEGDEEGEWDAKCWNDADLNLSGKSSFSDKESENEDLTKVVEVGGKNQPENEAEKKNKRKDLVPKKVAAINIPRSTLSDESSLRSPICCIMGHVDTGKTKLLDRIRGTKVQEGEAGGITQQIGATYIPAENIRERTRELKADAKLMVPGLLVIDTPGHESFTNLRSRGSGLCDIAVLVVDIMHGLEPQTIESLNLLKMRNTKFIVALNKVDRLYGWKTCENAPIFKAMEQQTTDVRMEFDTRLTKVVTQFKEQGLNTELYYKNANLGEFISIIPTSAISGEGVSDMLLWLVQQAQKTMVEKLTFSNKVQCTVLEVKVVEGHGTTIDVVLVNGVMHEGDQIIVCGMQGPILTTIRSLLTPHPMKELRVKGTFLHHKELKAAQCIKITAQGLEHAVAGSGLHVVGPDDDIERIKETVMEDMQSVLSRIDRSGVGVCVQASTLGSLEALLEYLKSPAVKIPVSGISLGSVYKKDVIKASVMLEKKKEYATILAFDVIVTPEARDLANEVGVKIFTARVIYHLFDHFKAYIDNIKEEMKKEAAEETVFPCRLKIIPGRCFNKKDPIVLGVEVLEGTVKVGTPICVRSENFIDLGRISSIEKDKKVQKDATKGQKVSIKIVGTNTEEHQKIFGRHFNEKDELVSHITRRSIDIFKTHYRDVMSKDEWKLLLELKKSFRIQ